MARPSAPRRLTSGTLTGGAVVSAAFFLVAGLADVTRGASAAGELRDLGALAGGLLAMEPWAWAGLGTLAVVATPALGLTATAYEYASVSDRRTVLMALTVLGVLAVSLVIAILR